MLRAFYAGCVLLTLFACSAANASAAAEGGFASEGSGSCQCFAPTCGGAVDKVPVCEETCTKGSYTNCCSKFRCVPAKLAP